MEAVLKILALGAAALFAVAVLVACWEHWFQRIKEPAPAPPDPPRAVSVDLDVDKLPAAPAPCDQTARQATLGAALDNMARPPGDITATAPAPGAWIETRPMVLTSTTSTTSTTSNKTETEPH